jgi:hypothetical protein
MEYRVNANSAFLKSREDWLEAMIMSNHGKTDEEIIEKAIKSWRNGVTVNISYHEMMANLLSSDSPTLARQHRLLATIYREICK